MAKPYPVGFRMRAFALVRAGISISEASQDIGLSRSGLYKYRHRPLSPTALRSIWPTGLITEIHAHSRGTH